MKLAILLCAASLAGAAWAQTNTPTSAPAKAAGSALGVRPVSLTITDMSLKSVLESLAGQSGQRILLGPEATGRLTMTVSDVPLEKALALAATLSGNRWSKITLPAEKARTLTPEQAQALVTAAQALAADALSVQTGDGPAVSVGVAPVTSAVPAASVAPKDAVTVYLLHTKTDPAAIRAAREAARKKETRAAETPSPGVAAQMSEDARQDPQLVNAYSALQMLSPNQVAVLAREYLIHSTPEQREAVGEAMRGQSEQIRDAMRNLQGQ
jgi:hypothetical protein